jgi:hypothetical protein
MFKQSLTRELGKNTGKWISNKVFGDGHSTPYRVKISRENAKLQEKEHERQLELEDEKQDLLHQQHIYELEGDIDQQIRDLARIKIPRDRESLTEFMNELSLYMEAKKWKPTIMTDSKDEKKGTIQNRLMDGYFSKFKFCLIKLESINPADPMVTYFKKQEKKFNRKKLFGKFKYFLLWLCLMGGLGCFYLFVK